MKRLLFSAVVMLPALLAAHVAPAADLRIVATTPEIAALVSEIGGERVEVQAIAKPQQDPHYVDAKPSYMLRLNRAHALFYNGLALEVGWLPLLVQGARNPSLTAVDLSGGIQVLDKIEGAVSRAGGDVHPEGNPHYWVDPRNGAIMAASIAGALARLDGAHAAFYRERLAAFQSTLKARLQTWQERLRPYAGTPIIEYHSYWHYFAAWAGLTIKDDVEDKPGIPPTATHVRTLMAHIEAGNIPLLIQSSYQDPKIPEFLARKTGIRVVRLPATVGGTPGVETYWGYFDHVVDQLVTALGPR